MTNKSGSNIQKRTDFHKFCLIAVTVCKTYSRSYTPSQFLCGSINCVTRKRVKTRREANLSPTTSSATTFRIYNLFHIPHNTILCVPIYKCIFLPPEYVISTAPQISCKYFQNERNKTKNNYEVIIILIITI